MGFLNERIVLIILVVVTSISTLFCLIGLAAPGWGGGFSVFAVGRSSTAALSIISLLLLIACVALAVILLIGIIQYQHLPMILVGLLIVTSFFLLGTFTSAFALAQVYSVNLMITAFTFTYVSSILAVYWLFGLKSKDESYAPSTRQPS
ncbi:unnamed protein product [Rotaria sp. Silwood1]|nr:unnamed protein product [Rotaria sp. Silwood1]